jgi:hypothetical protein
LKDAYPSSPGSALWTDGQLEILKWIAVVSMFIDHFGRHLLGRGQESFAFGAGRLAFPLFVFVLACNLARPGDRAQRAARVTVRLGIACAVSTPAVIWARGEPGLVNVFGTLGLGTALCWVLVTKGHLLWRGGLCVPICVAGTHVEFDLIGVCLLPAIYLWRAHNLREAAAFSVVLFLALIHLNGSYGGLYGYVGTLCAVPLAWVVAHIPLGMPRMRWLFYAIYPLHLALIGALNDAGMGQIRREAPIFSSSITSLPVYRACDAWQLHPTCRSST